MKARLTRIGNSQGIRSSKPLLVETRLTDEIDKRAEEGQTRDGWDQAFAKYAKEGRDPEFDDIPPSLTSWDEQEWEW